MSENSELLQTLIAGGSASGQPGSRNSAILQSIINGTEYTAEAQSEIEELLLELKQSTGGGSTPEKLGYGSQANWDDGTETETGSLVPLTFTEGTNFSEYLEYTAPSEGDTLRSGSFKVLKPFYGIIVPWVTNAQSSAGKPRVEFYYNNVNYTATKLDTYDVDYITTPATSEGSVGGLIPIAIDFKVDDVFGMTAVNGTGYPKVGLKIYKLFEVTPSMVSFFDGIETFPE